MDGRAVAAMNAEECIVHVWGLPWELDASDVAMLLSPMLPAQCRLLEAPLLPLDKKARNTGRALLRLSCGVDMMDEVVQSLNEQRVAMPEVLLH